MEESIASDLGSCKPEMTLGSRSGSIPLPDLKEVKMKRPRNLIALSLLVQTLEQILADHVLASG